MLKQKSERNAKRPISRPAIGPPSAGAPKYQQNSVQSTLVLGLVPGPWSYQERGQIFGVQSLRFEREETI